MVKKKTHYEPQVHSNGSFHKLCRPNLWTPFHCKIEGYENGLYVARVTRVEGSSFQILARLEELEPLSPDKK